MPSCCANSRADAGAASKSRCVTPYDRQLYSGMLPGWIAGHYTIDELDDPAASVCFRPPARGGLLDRIVGLDPSQRQVVTAGGTTLEYDLVSLATGSDIAADAIEGARQLGAATAADRRVRVEVDGTCAATGGGRSTRRSW